MIKFKSDSFHNHVTFSHTSNKILEKEINKVIPFPVASENLFKTHRNKFSKTKMKFSTVKLQKTDEKIKMGIKCEISCLLIRRTNIAKYS